MKKIEVDKRRFKKAYDKAVANNDQTFTYEGELFLTTYAKYLLECINDQES